MSEQAEQVKPRASWTTNLLLFVVTAASVFATGALNFPASDTPPKDEGFFQSLARAIHNLSPAALVHGAVFAGTILTILVAHEFGHYIAARIHRVDASLPFFLPMPILSPFGTMGAVIRMRGAIPTRRALLDIGAAGPLAGLAFALPLYAWGVAHSHSVPIEPDQFDIGESILIKVFDRLFAPAVPEGQVLTYSAVAFGAWGGLFVTMINLLPVGQLDGGHIAYALFGEKQNRYAQFVHRAMLVFFGVIIVGHLARDVAAGRALTAAVVSRHIGNLFWLVWFQVLAILGTLSSKAHQARADADADADAESAERPTFMTIRMRLVALIGLVWMAWTARQRPSWILIAGFFAALAILIAMEIRGGALRSHDLLDHPPTSEAPLDPTRKVIAIVSLLFFVLLFMPEPFSL